MKRLIHARDRLAVASRLVPATLPGQMLLWLTAVTAYCLVLVATARAIPYATAAISLILPAALYAAQSVDFAWRRIRQLFLITSYFMLVATISIFAIMSGYDGINRYAGYLFFIYFGLQSLGFVLHEIKKRSVLGIVSTIGCGSAIVLWGVSLGGWGSIIDAEGRFQMWGENAPLLIQGIYFFWVIRVLLESRTLPKLTELSAHTASILIALLSGQFFFVRLLTASQLFLLDGIARYSSRDFVSPGFMAFDEVREARFRSIYRRYISPTFFAILAVLVLLAWWDSATQLGLF